MKPVVENVTKRSEANRLSRLSHGACVENAKSAIWAIVL